LRCSCAPNSDPSPHALIGPVFAHGSRDADIVYTLSLRALRHSRVDPTMMIHLLKRTSLGVCTSQRLAACARRRLTLSSVVGALEPPLDHRSLPEYFESCLLPSFGERPALVCRTERERPFGGPSQVHESSYLRWTFGELDEHVAALARGLSQMGVQKGDRIGVIMGNNRCEPARFCTWTLFSWLIRVAQCICHLTVGLCKNWSYTRHHQPGLSCS
jgi:hypothetical protein